LEKNKSLIIPTSLSKVHVGLAWDTQCDIDSSVLLFTYSRDCKEIINFKNKQSANGSVIHSGDNSTGKGTGDDEVIAVNLDKIDKEI